MDHDYLPGSGTADGKYREWRCGRCLHVVHVPLGSQPLNSASECLAGKIAPVVSKPSQQQFGISGIESTLAERGSRYGSFAGHANITQRIKRAMVDSPNWMRLADDQREALDMVAHKIGRILNGDPDYLDSWVDIEGYVHLVTQRLNR